MTQSIVRILVVDDHEVVRRGLRAIIESYAGYVICGEAGNGREGASQALELQPDVVIMDVAMPELNGIDATRQVLQKSPRSQVLMLSIHEAEEVVKAALEAGARGYVLKSDAVCDLLAALDSLRMGQPYFTSPVAGRAYAKFVKETAGAAKPAKARNTLTRREREILQLLAEGYSNKEVAKAISISVKTAETHRARVMRKLQLGSVAELVRYAVRNHVIAA